MQLTPVFKCYRAKHPRTRNAHLSMIEVWKPFGGTHQIIVSIRARCAGRHARFVIGYQRARLLRFEDTNRFVGDSMAT